MIFALIGVGRWGRNIIHTLETIPEAKLKYLCARTDESLYSLPNKYEKLSDWRELLKKKDIKGVIIATPPSTHALIATTFLECGIAVFVEKPMVLSTVEASQIQNIVRKSGQVFMVGYQYLYNYYINFLKKEIERGFFGTILEVKSEHRVSPQRSDVEILWDAGPHPLSIFQYIFTPQKLLSVKGKIERDYVSVKVKFENAPELQIIASYLGKTKTRKFSIVGEKKVAVLDETTKKDKLIITKERKVTNPKIETDAPLREELKHFIDCVKVRRVPRTNIDFGYLVTKWLEEITLGVSNCTNTCD